MTTALTSSTILQNLYWNQIAKLNAVQADRTRGQLGRRSMEARAAFAKIDPLLQPSANLALCQDGTNDLSCVAVEDASSFAPLLKAEVIAQGRAVRAARTLPD